MKLRHALLHGAPFRVIGISDAIGAETAPLVEVEQSTSNLVKCERLGERARPKPVGVQLLQLLTRRCVSRHQSVCGKYFHQALLTTQEPVASPPHRPRGTSPGCQRRLRLGISSSLIIRRNDAHAAIQEPSWAPFGVERDCRPAYRVRPQIETEPVAKPS